MGGADKALIPLGGLPLARHVADRIAPQVAALAIVARADADTDAARARAALGLPMLADDVPGQPGPLAGLLAALDWGAAQGADMVLTVPVDTPFLPRDLTARLAAGLGDAPAAVARAGGRMQPVCGLWRAGLRAVLRPALLGGLRRVQDFAATVGAALVEFDDAAAFDNLNTPEDLHSAAVRLVRGTPQVPAFDRIVVVDWSARSSPSPRTPCADAIWIAEADANGTHTTYHQTRAAAEAALAATLARARAAGERLLAGFDFPFGYPAGFAAHVTGAPGAARMWDWLDAHIRDGPDNANNRFQVASTLNAMVAAPGPFWGRPAHLALPGLSDRKDAVYGAAWPERRRVETQVPRAQPVWKLYTTGSVGSQALLGLPMVARLKRRFGAAVWPFEPASGPLVLAEIYPSILDAAVRAATGPGSIKDQVQVRLLARALWRLQARGGLAAALAAAPDWPGRADEGWILGVGAEAALRDAAS